MKYFVVIIVLLCAGLISCQKLSTGKNCSDIYKGIQELETGVEILKIKFQMTNDDLFAIAINMFMIQNTSTQLLSILFNQQLQFAYLLYTTECSNDSPTYSLMKTSYDSSKDNGILSCAIITAIFTFLFNLYMIYLAYSTKVTLNRMYDRVPNPTFNANQ